MSNLSLNRFFSERWPENRILVVHGRKKPFKCKNCSYCFKKNDLKKHVASVQEKKKPFECQICEHSLSQKSALGHHAWENGAISSIHVTKRFSGKVKMDQFTRKITHFQLCRSFDKAFSLKGHIIRHAKSTHEERIKMNLQEEI